jgi:hypothetical protein
LIDHGFDSIKELPHTLFFTFIVNDEIIFGNLFLQFFPQLEEENETFLHKSD